MLPILQMGNLSLEVLCSWPRVTELKFKPVLARVHGLSPWRQCCLGPPGWGELGLLSSPGKPNAGG